MFRKIAPVLIAVFCALAAVTSAHAIPPTDSMRDVSGLSPFTPVGFIATRGYVAAPSGFLDFCKRYPEDCVPPAGGSINSVTLTSDKLSQLNHVNSNVNDSLFFNSDLSTRDVWDYPQDGIGDCEDFAIEKRGRLMSMGWPPETLLITLVKRLVPDYAGRTGHAVLTVRTAQGDYILDNGISRAVPWTTASRLFEYVMIQSQTDPQLWALVDSKKRLP